MSALYQIAEPTRFPGYKDLNGQFISFSMADEVFARARAVGARVLLRLELSDTHELKGIFYTNENGLCP